MHATRQLRGSAKRLALLMASVLSLAVASSFIVLGAGTQSVAQQNTTEASQTNLTLLDQTDWVKTGTNFELWLSVNTTLPIDQLDLAILVRNAVANRGQFRNVLDGDFNQSTIILERRPLGELQQPDGTFRISLPIGDQSQRRYYLRDNGVYPVQVELRMNSVAGKAISGFTTFLINTPTADPPHTPLGVANLLTAASAPPSDIRDPAQLPDEGKNIGVIAEAARQFPQLPFAIAPEANAIDRMQNANTEAPKATLKSLVDAFDQRQVVVTPYVPPAPGMYSPALEHLTTESMQRAKAILSRNFKNVDTQTWFSSTPLDAQVNATLGSDAMKRAVINEKDLVPQSIPTTLARPFLLSTGKNQRQVPTGQADQGLAEHFATPGALGAHRLLADLAVIWADYPGQRRAVIVAPPRSWNPESTFLTQYFRGLERSEIVSPIDIDKYFATPMAASGKSTATRKINSGKSSMPSEAKMLETNDRLRSYSTMLNGNNPSGERITQMFFWTTIAGIDNKVRNEWLDACNDELEKQIAGIHVPAERSIRLTSSRGEIPISVQNDNGYPVKIRITLVSSKLDFPQGSSRLISVERQQVTERFTIDAKTAGAFPMQVEITSPDGKLKLKSSKITVRSTATSAIGIGLTVGAIIFLVVWWIDSALSARRKRAKKHAPTNQVATE